MNILYKFYYYKNIISRNVSNLLTLEYNVMYCWYAIFFGIGCIFGLNLVYSINYLLFILIFILNIIFIILYYFFKDKNYIIKFLILSFLFFNLGSFSGFYRIKNIQYNPISEKIDNVLITGTIKEIKPTIKGINLTIDANSISYLEKILPSPSRVRIYANPEYENILLVGDKIKTYANLRPPPNAITEGGYDFRKIAFFKKIEAVGSISGNIEIIYFSGNQIIDQIRIIRKNIFSILKDNLGKNDGYFAAALFLGETGGIDRETLDISRKAGISHILCVSGLHLSLVAMLSFIFFRFILNLSNFIAFNFDIKKISCYLSIASSLVYLLLTGSQIAASRAFIMTTIMIISIIINRTPTPIRSLFIAVFIILFLNPEYILNPSFQLSFMAVLSLISSYEFYIKYFKNINLFGGIFGNIKLYIISNIYSCVIASFSTSVIVIYHFYNFPNYSIFTNLIAVPLMSIIIMPLGIIGVSFSLIFGHINILSAFLFKIISISIFVINFSAKFFTDLDGAVSYVGHIPNLILIISTIGFLWLFIMQTKLRLLGLIPILFSYLNIFTQTNNDFIVNFEHKFISFKVDNRAKIIGKSNNDFVNNYLKTWLGTKYFDFEKNNLSKILISSNVNFFNGNNNDITSTYSNIYYIINYDDKSVCKINIDDVRNIDLTIYKKVIVNNNLIKLINIKKSRCLKVKESIINLTNIN